ncbi:17963_t:CDS:2 [Cetraspora pellucida]|uniref:17963_t:CDS:1 n=1 Tax=Cetraspora pellucida TaxID=1433469 RepID=A0ACA9LTB4_9GLOM|nr:17963_t:CDS:2 [Cetraspora pellucida]
MSTEVLEWNIVNLSGTTDVAITGGTIVASVYGITQTFQICNYVTCPIPVGPFTFSGTINVPSNVSSSCFALQFTGVNVDMRAYDASGSILGCVQGNVPVRCS